jgi:hypothetical protein
LLVAAKAQYDGIRLQWTRTLEPLALNFVQYRRVANATTTTTGVDPTPFVTLSLPFPAGARQLLVPSSVLQEGATYQFRLGFPHPDFTYYSNSLVAKAFEASSRFVSHVLDSRQASSISISWEAPEYLTGLVGYQVSLLYLEPGNGGLANPSWNASQLQVATRVSLPSTEVSVIFGCIEDSNSSECLLPFTLYRVEISVVREGGAESPLVHYTSTLPFSTRQHDYAEVFGSSGDLFVVFQHNQSELYAPGTSIQQTMFAGARVTSKNRDVDLDLRNSTVQSLSASRFWIRLSDADFYWLLHDVIERLDYSEWTLSFGSAVQTDMPVIGYGLSFEW